MDAPAPRELTRRRAALADIAARASFLHERLQAGAEAALDAAEPASGRGFDAAGFLASWDAALGGGLDRRLGEIGLDRAAARRRIVPGLPPDTGWVDLLAEALGRAPETPRRPRYRVEAAPIAFEDLLVPFVEAGRARIARELGRDAAILADAAWVTLERGLLALLSRLALQTLCSELALHRALTGLMPWQDEGAALGSYRAFVAEAGGLHAILSAYPVLARLLALAVLNWVEAHGAMILRLRADWPALRRAFGLDGDPCRVDSIAPYRSDPHEGGRSVAILTLGTQVLVYKPRSLAPERALAEVLAWAGGRGFSAPYRYPPLLVREHHGWMGYAAPRACADAAGIAAFHRRVGRLVCLAAFLQLTDIHHENLVASGDQPVLVDAETLFHPQVHPQAPATGAADAFARALSDSGWFPPASGPDFSALGATADVATAFPAATCLAVNSDRMRLAHAAFRAPRRHNVPTLRGRPEPAAAHGASIVAGFAEMFGLVARERSSLVALIRGLGAVPGRFVARSSNAYGLLLQASLAPEALRDGAERGLLFERLRRAGPASRPDDPSVLDRETRALERMDVPRLPTPDGAAGDGPPGLEQVVARLERAAEGDRDAGVRQLRRDLARLPDPAIAPDPDTREETCHGR